MQVKDEGYKHRSNERKYREENEVEPGQARTNPYGGHQSCQSYLPREESPSNPTPLVCATHAETPHSGAAVHGT